jgi:hypothetical protein
MKSKKSPHFSLPPESMPLSRLSQALGLAPGRLDEGREILSQERQGARETLAGPRLPLDGTTSPEAIKRCAAIGITLGKEVDLLFREAHLPPGWTITPSSDDHRTTILRDAKGHQRGYIWYKAAYYDRSAYFRIQTRYWVQRDYTEGGGGNFATVHDRVQARNIWQAEPLKSPGPDGAPDAWEKYEEAQAAQNRAAVDWVSERYPDWENPAAYWEE